MPSHIYVVGRDIAKTFVIAPVVVVLDEGLNSWVLAPACQILSIPWVIILLLFIRSFNSSRGQEQPLSIH